MKTHLLATLIFLAITISIVLCFSVTPEAKAAILKILLIGLASALVGSAIALAEYLVKKRRERKLCREVQTLLAKLRNQA